MVAVLIAEVALPLSLLVSGLPRLNLLDALSPIIAERARGRGADVTWSAGLAGKIMWDNFWIALAPGSQRGEGEIEGESETEEGEDRRTRRAQGGGVSTAMGGDSRQRELL